MEKNSKQEPNLPINEPAFNDWVRSHNQDPLLQMKFDVVFKLFKISIVINYIDEV